MGSLAAMKALHTAPGRSLRALLGGAVALLLTALMVVPAAAAPQGTSIGSDLYMTGATISGDGPDNGRVLDSYQAAAFMQSWFAPSLVVSPTFADPPADATRYSLTIGVDASAAGNTIALGIPPEEAVGSFIVNYATDGTNAWISLPAEPLWPGAGIDEAHADKWFVAEPETIAAFNGKGVVQQTADSGDITFADEHDAAAATTSSSSSSPNAVLVIVVVLGALAVIIGATYAVNRRRTGGA